MDALAGARRIVIKVGTSVVTRPDGKLAVGRMGALAEGVAALHAQDRQVIVVSSGAIGLGLEPLGFTRRPRSVVDQQACAAAGQGALVGMYDRLFSSLGLTLAQVLLTEDDFHRRGRYVSLGQTLERLLSLGAVPLMNENDVVATQNLSVFGDNDRLAALVATHLACDALVLLTDVDAVRTAPPGDPTSQRIPVMHDDQEVTLGPTSAVGRGGMAAKIRAARLAAKEGVASVIASGFAPDTLPRLLAGDDLGTWFPPAPRRSSRQRWLSLATVPVGALHVNDGARRALVEGRASLLQPGITSVEGAFDAMAIVRIVHDGTEFARGQVTRDASGIQAALGSPERDQVVVHRDLLAILPEVSR